MPTIQVIIYINIKLLIKLGYISLNLTSIFFKKRITQKESKVVNLA